MLICALPDGTWDALVGVRILQVPDDATESDIEGFIHEATHAPYPRQFPTGFSIVKEYTDDRTKMDS